MAGLVARAYGAVRGIDRTKGTLMKEHFRTQTWRVIMLLSTLASLSLVLMAGRRW